MAPHGSSIYIDVIPTVQVLRQPLRGLPRKPRLLWCGRRRALDGHGRLGSAGWRRHHGQPGERAVLAGPDLGGDGGQPRPAGLVLRWQGGAQAGGLEAAEDVKLHYQNLCQQFMNVKAFLVIY
jgi:hypothetical protein